MTWRCDGFPGSAYRLKIREPLLCAKLVGWFDGAEPLLVTRDARGRFWLWAWERSIFVDARGELNRATSGTSLAPGEYVAQTRLWVPQFGPWTSQRLATASDHMTAIVDLLQRTAKPAARQDAAGASL